MSIRQDALNYIKDYIKDTYYYWDKDHDSKVGKRLSALAGVKGYDFALDAAFEILEKE